MYEEAQKYLNNDYASSARCVGSDPADPDWDATTDEEGNLVDEAEYYTKEVAEKQNEYQSYMELYYNTLKNTDEKYNTDWTQMGTITSVNIKGASNYYWLASRYVYPNSYISSFSVRHVDSSGGLQSNNLCIIHYNGYTNGTGNSSGFRPVFTLKSGIEITEGDGVNTPYTLVP